MCFLRAQHQQMSPNLCAAGWWTTMTRSGAHRCAQLFMLHHKMHQLLAFAHHQCETDITILCFVRIMQNLCRMCTIVDRDLVLPLCPFQELVNLALQRHASDNVTAVIVCFSEQSLSPLSPQRFRHSMLRKSASSTSLRIP